MVVKPFHERGDDKLQVSGWHNWEWVGGLELLWMLLDRYEHTLDPEFLQDAVLSTAHQVLTFFDRHYEQDERGQAEILRTVDGTPIIPFPSVLTRPRVEVRPRG